MEYQIRKGSKILSRHKTRKEARQNLGRLLYYHNNLALVEVKYPKPMVKKGTNFTKVHDDTVKKLIRKGRKVHKGL
jgi:hypothetical protein|tara:strand:- start:2348 stop:2575 length:228 start_codon:yes stop_codon:yes gene_type:complete